MKQFNNLSEQEKESLLKFPAYISRLAADCDDKLVAVVGVFSAGFVAGNHQLQ